MRVSRGCLLLLFALIAAPASAQMQRTFVNLGFEAPDLGSASCYVILDELQIPGWTTTHPPGSTTSLCPGVVPDVPNGRLIELWANGGPSGVPARFNQQHAELNASNSSRIYQDVCLTNGETVSWRLSHRGRDSATIPDVMDFGINVAGNTATPVTTRIARIGTTHTGSYAINDDVRVGGRLNYATTEDEVNPSAGATFAEGNVGVAWRPHDATQVSLLGKYSFEYDLSTLAQVESGAENYDQRTQVLSVEGIYHPERRWELGAKAAHRVGEVRYGRAEGEWADSTASLYALQARMEFAPDWSALAEHRWLNVLDGGDQRGFLVGVDRDLGSHVRVGVGYSFANFSDDLTDLDHDEQGFFINFTGAF